MYAPMILVNVHDAKTNLSSLIAAVEKGEEVIIARNGTPVVQLMLYKKHKSLLGCAEGFVEYMADDFNAPLEDFREYQ